MSTTAFVEATPPSLLKTKSDGASLLHSTRAPTSPHFAFPFCAERG